MSVLQSADGLHPWNAMGAIFAHHAVMMGVKSESTMSSARGRWESDGVTGSLARRNKPSTATTTLLLFGGYQQRMDHKVFFDESLDSGALVGPPV